MSSFDYAAFGIMIIAVLFLALIITVIDIIASWVIFKKAGKPGWHAVIPFLSTYDLFDITWSAKMGIFTIVLAIVVGILHRAISLKTQPPAVNLTFSFLAIILFIVEVRELYYLSKSFGHGVGFFFGLWLLNPVFMLILAFGSSQYIGPKGVPVGGIYGNGVYAQPMQDHQAQGFSQPQQVNPFENNYDNYR